MRAPFSLFKKPLKSRVLWYARFWDVESKSYSVSRSTGIPVQGKRERRAEAYEVARSMIGVLRQEAKDFPLFLDFVSDFWNDDSAYVKARRLGDRKPLSAEYVQNNREGIRLHVADYPGFKGLRLDKLKAGLIEDWKLWALERGGGTVRLNAVLGSMRVALRWAVDRGELENDPFEKVKALHEPKNEKGILTPAELRALLAVEDPDIRVRCAVLLAALCGLRRGEVRGLQWGDIDEAGGIIHVRNNFVRLDGAKDPKWGSARRVVLPSAVLAVLHDIREQFGEQLGGAYVLADPASGTPLGEGAIRSGLARMLKAVGINAEAMKARSISFHSLRHGFITLARAAGLPDITVQALAGHRSAEMMNHYSHGGQVIDFVSTREVMEKALKAQ